MKKKKIIWGNCLVRNEENWVWYALMSVIDCLDKILVWDTGSTDKTVPIIKSIKNPKISFKQYGPVTPETFADVRQKMLKATKADWLFLIDGDEIWSKKSIKKVVEEIQRKGDRIDSVVVETINFVGDVFHYQEEEAGEYEIAGKRGHYNLRAMNWRIPGLHAALPHGQQGYFDAENNPIQKRNPKKILFLPVHYFHATHLPRSLNDNEVPMRKKKRKYEIGIPLPKKTEYPEVFNVKRPEIVPGPWVKMSKKVHFRSILQTPLKKIKRKLSPR